MSDRIHTRIEPNLKKDVASILNQLGLSESEAIRMFYNQIKIHHGLPFSVKIPNAETLNAFDESDNNENTLRRHNSFDSFESSIK